MKVLDHAIALVSVHATSTDVGTRPPNSSDSGTFMRCTCTSKTAVSTAHLAKRLPWKSVRNFAIAAPGRVASMPLSSGAK
jgi:hypothetical protein